MWNSQLASRFKALGRLIPLALIASCEATPQNPPEAAQLVCIEPDPPSEGHAGTRDPPIHHGFVYLDNVAMEFRPCNRADKYLVDASFMVENSITQYASVMSPEGERSLYIRFHGRELDCKMGLPDRYENVIKIEQLLIQDIRSPANCR